MTIDYKKLDNTFILFCPSFIILMFIVGILSSTIGAAILKYPIIFTIFLFLGIFSAVYLIWSFCFWIVGLISQKARDNHKFRFMTKLITSVIVAILITYTLLVPICGDNCGGRNTSPITNTKILLQTQINNPGAEQCTDYVTFSRSNSQLSAEGITRDTGLNPDQVVFANPREIPGFEASNSLLKYGLTTKKNVFVCIICSDNGKTRLEQALVDNGASTTINSTIEGQTLCVVYPKKNNLT
jgi:hypothetical protein